MGGIGFITEIGAEVMHDNSLINTFMLEAARVNKIRRYLYTSSACVYPTYRQTDPNIKGLREEDAYPADPDNFYGWKSSITKKCVKLINATIRWTYACYVFTIFTVQKERIKVDGKNLLLPYAEKSLRSQIQELLKYGAMENKLVLTVSLTTLLEEL